MMAVSLSREDGTNRQTNQGNPTSFKLPQVRVHNLPVVTPEGFQNGPVTGRTQTVYSCWSPGRGVFWKDNYERRQSQLSEGGFHGSPGHKYKEIGDVELDDKTLILQGLGQMNVHTEPTEHYMKLSDGYTDQPAAAAIAPNMRARTTIHSTDQLITLHQELHRVDTQLDKVRKGCGLFHMLHNERTDKELKLQQVNEKEKKLKANEWLPPVKQDLKDTSYSTLPNEESQDIIIEDNSCDSDEISITCTKLCTILWILECMKLESPHFMPSLYTYWFKKRPIINEDKGRLIYDKTLALLKIYESMTQVNDETGASRNKEIRHKCRPSSKNEKMRKEEFRIRMQRRLSPEQIEKLKLLIEEELNRAKKRTRNSIKKLMEEKAMQNSVPSHKPQKGTLPHINIDPDNIAASFDSVKETRDLIVHEQLSVMARERQEAIEQRFTALEISGNIWTDLTNMRQGVQIETTAMARNKLMMNYNWLVVLKRDLPSDALDNVYCKELLIDLSSMEEYMRVVGPTIMSQERLLSVLSLLRPWELESPIINWAIQFIIDSVIYIVPKDFQVWIEYQKQNKQ